MTGTRTMILQRIIKVLPGDPAYTRLKGLLLMRESDFVANLADLAHAERVKTDNGEELLTAYDANHLGPEYKIIVLGVETAANPAFRR